MDFLLNDESDSDDDDQIRNKLLQEMDQMSNAGNITERSFYCEQFQPQNNDFQESETWKAFLAGADQREAMLKKAEEQIEQMKKINQGEDLIQIIDDAGEIKQIVIAQQIDKEKLAQIKQQVQQTFNETKQVVILEEPIQQLIVEEPKPQVNPKKPSRFLSKNNNHQQMTKQQQQDQINERREQIMMEMEDISSAEFRLQCLNEFCKNRLFTLPSSFPALQPVKITPTPKTPSIPQQYLAFQTPDFVIPAILDVTPENLAPSNSKELVWEKLRKVKYLQLQQTQINIPKQVEIVNKENKIVQLDLAPKLNIIYQDKKKIAKQQVIFESKEEIFWNKINHLHEETYNMQIYIQLEDLSNIYNYPMTAYDNAQPADDIDMLNIQDDQQNSVINYCSQNQIKLNTRRLEIKLENIQDYTGIGQFVNLKQLILSSNNLTKLNDFQQCKGLIEINLSQNVIDNYSCLGQLSNLRILVMEMNKITKIHKLQACIQLEILNLGGNQIQVIENLENMQYLKHLVLFKNQIKEVAGLHGNYLLESLDLGSNQINFNSLDNPFKYNQCLRKLILYKNRVSNLPYLSLLMLTEIYLNKNKLESLNGFQFLPNLQTLHAQDNNLQSCLDLTDQIVYMPSLKTLNIARNQIQSFGTILKFVETSHSLNDIDYADNQFLFQLTDDVLQLYKYLLLNTCSIISRVNQQSINKEDVDFLRTKFFGFFSSSQTQQTKCQSQVTLDTILQQMQQQNLDHNKLNSLQGRKLTKDHPFSFTKRFKELQIKDDYLFLKHNYQQQFNNQEEIRKYEQQYQDSLIKIKNGLFRFIYKHRKVRRYYASKITSIVKVQALYRGILIRNQPEIKQLAVKLKNQSNHKYAVRIQKVFRGYRLRKKMKALLGNIKFEDPDMDMDGFDDFDAGFIQQEINMNYDLKIPKGMDIQQILKMGQQQQQHQQHQLEQISAEVKQKGQQMQQLKNMSQNELGKSQQQVGYRKQQSNEPFTATNMSGSKFQQMASSKYSDKTNKSEQLPSIQKPKLGVEQIMQNWGFKDTQVAQTLALKMEKERQRKLRGKAKLLTADERLQKFKQAHPKI